MSPLTVEQQRAIETLRGFIDVSKIPVGVLHNPSITDFAHEEFYIPSDPPSTIGLYEHQQIICEYALDPVNDFETVLYSTTKKGGKTAVAGMVGRYKAQYSGPYSEVYMMANDKEQAKGRIYKAAVNSIEIDPRYDKGKRELQGVWHVKDNESTYLKNGSTMRAVPIDYAGEAGSNPTFTAWSEIHGFRTKAQKRMYAEMTPVPTRKSMRWVETYAGYWGESDVLQRLWDTATLEDQGAVRLTRDDLREWGREWPYDEEYEEDLPLFVNKSARLFAYVDQGPRARRMAWQTPEYYVSQAKSMGDPDEFLRLHENLWISAVSQFVPIEWWKACQEVLPPIKSNERVVLGADASVDHDGTALVAVTLHPNNPNKLAVRGVHLWKPSRGHPIDYTQTIEPEIRRYCAQYDVVQLAYDPYQLHDMCTRLKRDFVVWAKPFGQMGQRLEADKAFQDLIRDRLLSHDGDPIMETAIQNCAAKKTPNDNSKLRIVKKSQDALIDPAVAASMACHACKELILEV